MGRRRAFAIAALVSLSCGPRQDLGRPRPGGHDMASSSGSDDGGNAYGNPDGGGAIMCTPPQMAAVCPSPLSPSAGCGPMELCGPNNSGNGVDDNCNGVVDENCPCRPGDVERCFLGPPGKQHVGACTDGTATCEDHGEFGQWGPCVGSIGPSPEVCDGLDNDCNGCVDDGLCCDSVLSCPSPGDPRIAPQPPYTDVNLLGGMFFTGSAASWSWTVLGGPCDRLFLTTTNPVKQSFALSGQTTQNAKVHFTLSGDYTVTLTIMGTDGHMYTCTWIQHVIGPGVRVELCWDNEGLPAPLGSGGDLDLHVHRSSTVSTTDWFVKPDGTNNPDDCDFRTCKAGEFPSNAYRAEWGYTNSNISACIGAPEGSTWQTGLHACHNPRLDIDNVSDIGRPENINIDNPANGDTFRAMVHYYNGTADEHPLVNIYCGGTLKATYGQAPNQISGFNDGKGWDAGLIWRVADVQAKVDGSGVTTDCTVTQRKNASGGFDITTDDMHF
jgi:hypothetical protein